MKIMVLSDTHGNYPLAIRAIDQAGVMDCIVHLGDEMADAGIIEDVIGAPIIKVPGNCDQTATEPREVLKTFAGKRFFITHGDRYNVKAGLGRLQQKALDESVQVALYGHTHVASVELIGGIFFVNPGTLAKGRSSGSYAVITIQSDTVTVDIALIVE